MARKKKTDALSSEELSKEFFGNGAALAPGQDEPADGTTDLVHAIVESRSRPAGGGAGRGAGGGMGGSGGGAGAGAGGPGGQVPGMSEAESPGARNGGDTYSLFDTEGKREDFGPDYSRRSWFSLGGGDDPAVNPYAAEQDKRYAMDPRAVKLIRIIVLAVIAYLFCALVMPSPTYNVEFGYSFSGVVTSIQENIALFFDMIAGHPHGALMYKLCTYGIYVFAGATLAITGAVYQGTLKNALASPTTLGINAGGTLGVTLFVLFVPVALLNPISGEATMSYQGVEELVRYYNSLSLPDYLIATQGSAFASILGCFVVVGLVMLVSHLVGRGTSSSYALIICGQVVALVASSVVEFVRYYLTEADATGVKASYIRSMQGGAIDSVSTPLDLLLVAVPCIAGIAVIIVLRRKLNLLAFNDEEARSMGIATERLRWTMVGACTFITAIIVSFCGNIGFVGFSIPLIVRRYVGPDFNYLIPVSAVMGALFMVVTFWLTDFNLFSLFGIELPASVNIFTSVIGLAMFVYATIQQRRLSRSADWL